MESLTQWLGKARELLDVTIIETGDTRITLWSLLYVVVFVVVLFWIAGWLQRWLARGPLTRTALDAGSRQAVATITRYVLLLVGFLVLLQTAGIDLTTFNVLAGAIGLGFELRAWSSSLVHRKGRLTSALNCAIYDKFNEAGIAFPFPQRDLHVRGGVLEVRQAKGAD